MKTNITNTQFDAWLSDDSPYAALVLQQQLMPIEGKEFGVIFPPTYAQPEEISQEDKKKWTGYNIDYLPNGSTICQIDSVGSQANRVEPMFKTEKFCTLVPQIIIKSGDKEINLLDAGHRAADAIVRFSDIDKDIKKAYLALQNKGDAEPLAKIAPTSIVFGSWDSRATQTKLPRIFRSEIRAYNVDPIHRSAQYATSAGQILDGAEVEVTTKGMKAYLGLAHIPASWKHGGVVLRKDGKIVRSTVVNLVAIRALRTAKQTMELRRYILGLSLVAFTSPLATFLREGCHLIPDQDTHPNTKSELICNSGKEHLLEESFALNAAIALDYANLVQAEFNSEIAKTGGVHNFDAATAKKQLNMNEADVKKEMAKYLATLAKGG